MKKIILAVLLITILLTACGRPSDEVCTAARIQMLDGNKWERLDGMQVNMILNNSFPPDSIGEILQDCINGGWEDY